MCGNIRVRAFHARLGRRVRSHVVTAALLAIGTALVPALPSQGRTASGGEALIGTAVAPIACTDRNEVLRAARDLYGEGTELVRIERVAGLQSALVLEPRI